MLKRILAITLVCLGLGAGIVHGQFNQSSHYPFAALPDYPGHIALIGVLDGRSPLAFERALESVPGAQTLVLNSDGGSVFAGLAIAKRVHAMGLATVVPEGAGCFSACSYLFFAGRERLALGALGVHQVSTQNGQYDLRAGQFAIADIYEALSDFDVPSVVLEIMLRTPPEDMYIFSDAEKQALGFLGSLPSRANPSGQLRQVAPRALVSPWYVVAGSFPKSEAALVQARAKRLEAIGLSPKIVDTDTHPRFQRGFYAVVFGATTRAEADRIATTVRRLVPDAYVVRER